MKKGIDGIYLQDAQRTWAHESTRVLELEEGLDHGTDWGVLHVLHSLYSNKWATKRLSLLFP